jgi:hypothetical protein
MTEFNSNETKPKPGPRSWQNILLMLVVTGITLVVADRIFIAYEQSQLVPKLPDISGTGPVNLSALRYNDGMVNRESGDEYRILSFGDSFTYSVMDPEWSYNGIIQSRLNAENPDMNIRVINLGEPATGTRHFREAHDFWSQILEHDAVLFHIFLGNDVQDDAFLHASLEWAPNVAIFTSDNPILEAGNRRVPQKFPLRMMDYAYAWWMSSRTRTEDNLPPGYNWAALTSFDEETFNAINFKFMDNWNPQEMNALLAGYEQVYLLLKRAQEVSESGKKVMIALGPAEPQVNHDLRAAALASGDADAAQYDLALAQRIIGRLQRRFAPDVPLIDLSWEFRRVYEETGEKLFFRRNTHWDKAGNQLAGEVIARQMSTDWLGMEGTSDPLPKWEYTPRVSDEEIDSYIALLSGADSLLPRVSGAIRAIQMFDGIRGRSDNWAIAPLKKEVLIEFPLPVNLSSMQLSLYQSDGRTYRFRVEAKMNSEWNLVADYSESEIGGTVDISLNGLVSAIRLVGLYNSTQENNPANAFLHIEEITFTE